MLTPMTDASPSPAEMRVHAALERLYREFAAPVPDRIEGCPCCIATRGVDVLLATPLRQLTGEQLWGYVSGAFLTVGNEDDFRYLLPRILDVSVNDPGYANDPEIVLGKLSLADWRSWSDGRQRAIEEFVDAWFELALVRDRADADDGWIDTEAESVMCGAARAGFPLAPWLARLHEPDAQPILADLRNRFPGELSGFWELAPAGFSELSAVLAQGEA